MVRIIEVQVVHAVMPATNVLVEVHDKHLQLRIADFGSGRGALLNAMKARILMRMGRPEGMPQLREAVSRMQAAKVSNEEIAPFRKQLAAAATH